MVSTTLQSSFDQYSEDDVPLQGNMTSNIVEKSKTTSTLSCIVALIEGRGVASEVGIASYNTETAECVVEQLADTSGYSRTLTLLNIHSPSKIILYTPSESVQTTSKLFVALAEHFEPERMTTWPRKMFNDNTGMQRLTSMCLPELLPSIMIGLAKKCFALSAISALFSYMESVIEFRCASGSIAFKVGLDEGVVSIDYASAKSLELVYNARNLSSKQHLLGTLDHTLTNMGRRLLRLNILRPINDIACITVRQECVKEMLEHEELFKELREALKQLPDVDQLITLLVQIPKIEGPKDAERRVHILLALKQTLKTLTPLSTLLQTFQHPLLILIRNTVDNKNLQHIHELLNTRINNDILCQKNRSMTQQQRAFAINLGLNTLLDVARKTFQECIEDINEYAEALGKYFDLPLQVKYKAPRGFHLTLPQTSLLGRHLPDIFCNVTGTNRLAFTTLDLLKLNQRANESISEIFLLSDQVVLETLNEIRVSIGCLYKAGESIATLDMLCSFAEYASIAQCVCPEMTRDVTAIKAGRHPILDRICPCDVVSNDVLMCQSHSFLLITSPNMSGKSTFLRQLALLTIMAHMGMFLPAEQATVRLTDAIFTRIGSDDDMESNASTFFVEMREMAYAMSSSTSHSLIIVDELGRGTSTLDGLSITTTICETLAQTSVFVAMVTHFTQLVNYLTSMPNVAIMSLTVGEQSGKLSYSYKINSGSCSIQDYGLKLAKQIGLNEQVMEVAYQASNAIKRAQGNDSRLISVRKVLEKRKLVRQTAEKIKNLLECSKLPREEFETTLTGMRNDFQTQLDALD